MALCTRCGRQAEPGAEFCSDCGGYSVSAAGGRAVTTPAMAATADYLRPFAPEGAVAPALPDGREMDFWTDPVEHGLGPDDEQGWSAPSPSGLMPDFTSPRGEPPAPAEEGILPAGQMCPTDPAYQSDDTYPPPTASDLGRDGAYLPAQGRSVTLSGEAYTPAGYADPDERRAPGGAATRPYFTDGEQYDPSDTPPPYLADEDRYGPAAQPYLADEDRYGSAADVANAAQPADGERYDASGAAPPYSADEDRYGPAAESHMADEDRYSPSGTAWAYTNADRFASGAPSQTDPVVPYVAAMRPYPAGTDDPADGTAPWAPADRLGPADALTGVPAANDYSASFQGQNWPAEQADLPLAGLVADAIPAGGSPWGAPPDAAPPSSDRQRLRFRRTAAPTPDADPDGRGFPLAPDASQSDYRGLPADSAIPADRRLDQRGAPSMVRSARPADHGRWITFAAAAIVLVIAGASAAILLARHDKPHVASGPKPATTSSPRPTSAPTASTADGGLITADPPAASAPHSTAVVAFLTRYFTAINDHDYAAYRRLFSPSLRGGLSPTAFASGYGSSKDSQATLHSISVPGAGQIVAAVTFTSHQQATASATNSSCTDWSISLYLIRQGHSYVIESPPAGYQSTSSPCS